MSAIDDGERQGGAQKLTTLVLRPLTRSFAPPPLSGQSCPLAQPPMPTVNCPPLGLFCSCESGDDQSREATLDEGGGHKNLLILSVARSPPPSLAGHTMIAGAGPSVSGPLLPPSGHPALLKGEGTKQQGRESNHRRGGGRTNSLPTSLVRRSLVPPAILSRLCDARLQERRGKNLPCSSAARSSTPPLSTPSSSLWPLIVVAGPS